MLFLAEKNIYGENVRMKTTRGISREGKENHPLGPTVWKCSRRSPQELKSKREKERKVRVRLL